MSTESVHLVRRLWKAAERGDTEAAFALLRPGHRLANHTGGPVELLRTYHGHEGVRQRFRQWLQSFENFRPHAETFVDAGDNVVVGWRETGSGKASGAEVEMSRWNLYGIRNVS